MALKDAPRCQHVKRNGEPCKNPARRGYRVCSSHGAGKGAKRGGRPPTHGRRSKLLRLSLGKAIEKHRENPDPLNLMAELATARALRDEMVARAERADGDPEALDRVMAYVEATSRIVKRIEDIRAQDAISRPELMRVMAEMGRNAEHRLGQLARRVAELVPPAQAAHLEDLFGEAREAIAEDWNRIQIA